MGVTGSEVGTVAGGAIGTAILPGVGTVIGSELGSAIGGLFDSGPKYKPLDISSVISQAQTQATNDLQNSINLENEFLPGTAGLRVGSNAYNQNLLSGNTAAQRTQSSLLGGVAPGGFGGTNSAINNPLTKAANSSILQSLNMGGQLDPSTQAQIAQSALAGAGVAGISGSGAGRGLVASDIGLSSLQLLQSRQNQASAAGNAYGALQLQAQGLNLQSYLGQLGAAQTAVNSQNSYGLGIGQLMNSTPYPTSGLSPDAVANLYIAQNNAQNQANGTAAMVQQQQSNGVTSGLLGAASTSSTAGSGIAKLFAGSGGSGADAALAAGIGD